MSLTLFFLFNYFCKYWFNTVFQSVATEPKTLVTKTEKVCVWEDKTLHFNGQNFYQPSNNKEGRAGRLSRGKIKPTLNAATDFKSAI